MYKDEEEEMSLNENFSLPDMEEDFNIEEIPTIEEMFSIDKEEVAQIQKNSSVSSDNAEDTSEALNLNTQSENSVLDTEENIVPEFGTDILNKNFDNLSSNVDLLNTDDMLVTDEDTLNTAESAGDLTAASVMPEIEEVEEERLNSHDFDENLRNDNEFSPEFAETDSEEIVKELNISDTLTESEKMKEMQSENIAHEKEEVLNLPDENIVQTVSGKNINFIGEPSNAGEETQYEEQNLSVEYTYSENELEVFTENSFENAVTENIPDNGITPAIVTNFSENEFEGKNTDIYINDYNSNDTDVLTIENNDSVKKFQQPDDVFARIDALLDDNETFDITSPQVQSVNTADFADTTTSIPQQEYETDLNSEIPFADGEFVNEETFDFSYDETESFVDDNVSEEAEQQKYKSAFNPIKYMRETISEKKEIDADKENFDFSYTGEEIPIPENNFSEQPFTEPDISNEETSSENEEIDDDNKENFDFSYMSEEIPIPENNFSEQPFTEPDISNEEISSENENANNKDVLEFLYAEDGTADSAENLVSSENEEEYENFTELNLDEPSGKDNPLTNGKAKKIILSAAVCAVLIGAGITAVSVFNRKSAEEIAELTQNDITTPLEAVNSTDTSSVIVKENTNLSADIPDINNIKQPKVDTVTQDVIKDEIRKRTTPINRESYLSVSKIQWQVPYYLSYSPNINSYLQTAGKSIKLQISSDLLLVNEYAYSNLVKVSLKLNNSGVLQSTNILTSSGSKQIDDIVLQSVKSTLNVLKLPAGEVKTPDLNLTITIYL